MSKTATPGVIVDSCVPRTPKERAVAVLDYLETLIDERHDPDGDLTHARINVNHTEGEDAEEWGEIEDQLIGWINKHLPDDLVCTCGEFTPGDVIIREVNPHAEGVW